MDVVYVQRRPAGAQVSIERLFDRVRGSLGPGVRWRVHVCPCAGRGVVRRLRNLWSAWWACRRGICHLTGDVHYLALVVPRRRVVLTVHDCAVLHRLGGWRRELVRLLWYVWPVRHAGVVTAVSEATREDMRRWLGDRLVERVQVISNCVGDEFVEVPKEWDDECPVVLQVGTGWNKNVERVAEALKGLRVRWWIVGPLRDEQRALLDGCGVAYEALGRLTDDALAEVYRQSDLLVFASLFEGFGLPILEAQATGRPVVTSACSSMPEVAGDGALLVDPGDVGSIRDAVERLMRDGGLRRLLIERGLENVERFRGNRVASLYEAVYKNMSVMSHTTPRR